MRDGNAPEPASPVWDSRVGPRGGAQQPKAVQEPATFIGDSSTEPTVFAP